MTLNSAFRIIAMLALTCSMAAQDGKPWRFPAEARPHMEAALRQFTEAQAQGRWDDVAKLLGDYRRSFFVGYMRYTTAHKECLIEAMKQWPIVSFDYQIQESSYSSELLLTPPERRWWTLEGEASVRTSSGLIKRRMEMIAYRDGENWFFTPPPIDNADLSKLFTESELAADRADLVEIRIPADAPLQVTGLHVHIDPDNLTSRNVEFRLHNTTEKRATAYSFTLDDERHTGSISFGTGAEKDKIRPGGDSALWKESYNMYLYRCEGEAKIRITLEDVTLEDGTKWELKKPVPDSATPQSR